MTIILRVFPRHTSFTPIDEMAFVGDPPLWRPPADEVHVSVTFTWDREEGQRLLEAWGKYYPIVKIGGPAFYNNPDGFIPGLYVKPGITFTTRGCNNHCPWCLVPFGEGKLIEIKNFAPGWIIQDNNLLQASKQHISRVFDMLRVQNKAVTFSGGLQSDLVTDWFVDQLKTIYLYQLFLACDTVGALKPLEKAIKNLSFLDRHKLRVYVMIGKNETIEQARERLQSVWDVGGLPFAQLYQPANKWIDYPSEWRALARTWSRPAAIYALHKV
jgi:hypothetical protein